MTLDFRCGECGEAVYRQDVYAHILECWKDDAPDSADDPQEDFSVIQCTCGVNSISPYVFTNEQEEHASYCRITRYHRWIATRGQSESI